MGCGACSRNRARVKTSNGSQARAIPDIVQDFTQLEPSITKIRAGNGQTYSLLGSLVKMRPPAGWNLWISIKGHKHYIEGKSAKEVVDNVIAKYALNDIEIKPKVAWFNVNKIWVATLSPRHTYVTIGDLNAIARASSNPLIWNKDEWVDVMEAINSDEYDVGKVREEVKELYDLANHDILGCEVCYDDLTKDKLEYSNQEFMIEWVNARYENIVKGNV